jgi:hypothetical protein
MPKQKDEEAKPELRRGEHHLELGVMKPGDYMIHVFVENSKHFVPQGSEESQSAFNAVLQLNCGD